MVAFHGIRTFSGISQTEIQIRKPPEDFPGHVQDGTNEVGFLICLIFLILAFSSRLGQISWHFSVVVVWHVESNGFPSSTYYSFIMIGYNCVNI